MSLEDMTVEQLCVNTIRTLSIDMVTRADSGHPGAPLGCAAIAYALFARIMRHDPADPDWPDRDRFVLSAGHASALLYSVLHLSGYDLPMEQLQNFRQLGSMTPGHPEYGHAPGVEMTTGPLGQGLAGAVGMAIAERYLAERFNRPEHAVVDHFTYVLASDGDLMEGISHEAASLAGFLGLGKLIVLYDDNDISLEGPTSEWFTDDTAARFAAYGWQVLHVEDATSDVDAVCRAVEQAKADPDRPAIVMCRTHIGFASPAQDSSAAHGKALTPEEVAATKRNLGWPEDQSFLVPERAVTHMATAAAGGATAHEMWNELFDAYAAAYPEPAAEWTAAWAGELPAGWEADLPAWSAHDGPLATRSAAGAALEALRKSCWHLVGGAADLGSSTSTLPRDKRSMTRGRFGCQNVRFGVREFAMGAACNGLVLHGPLRAYGSTFTVFSDYCRPAMRLSGLMGLGVVYQFTHDSVGLGEDGPTHQPVEHLAALRAMPNWTVIRPADANEAAEAWRVAMLNADGPTAIVCSRQKLPVLERDASNPASLLAKGAYVMADCDGLADVILMATGSEVSLALAAARRLAADGVKARVVSFPSWELFERQPSDYRDAVLPPAVRRRLAVEAGVSQGWRKYVGDAGAMITVDRYGASGPGPDVLASLGFSVENVVARAKELLGA